MLHRLSTEEAYKHLNQWLVEQTTDTTEFDSYVVYNQRLVRFFVTSFEGSIPWYTVTANNVFGVPKTLYRGKSFVDAWAMYQSIYKQQNP